MKPLQSFFAVVAGILAVSCANRTVGSSADKDIVINDTLTQGGTCDYGCTDTT